MKMLLLTTILTFAALPLSAQQADSRSETAQRGRILLFRASDIFAYPLSSNGTAALIDAQRILQRDNAREAAKERAYWDAVRQQEEEIIGERVRGESDAKLLFARERGQALAKPQAVQSGGTSDGDQETPTAGAGDGVHGRFEDDASAEIVVQPNDGTFDPAGGLAATGDALQEAAQNIAAAAEEAFVGKSSREGPKLSSMILALVAIFLVPSVTVLLLALAVLSLRGGHRLQAAVLGGAGCILGLLVVVAVQPPPDDSTRLARLRAECERDAVRLSGYVDEVTEEGVVIDDVAGAGTDEHGSVIVLTEKRPARGREEWDSAAYPVGQQVALNALGIMRPMPAYSDNLDVAVAILAEAERARSEWWWHRAFRSLQQSLGPRPQRLITLK